VCLAKTMQQSLIGSAQILQGLQFWLIGQVAVWLWMATSQPPRSECKCVEFYWLSRPAAVGADVWQFAITVWQDVNEIGC